MRLIEKIILLMLCISLLPIMVVGGIFYSSVRSTVQSQTINQLNSIATIQENRLVDIRAQNLKRLTDFTSRKQLRILVESYNGTGSKSTQAEITAIINDAKTLAQDVYNITVVDTNGTIIVSTEKNPTAAKRMASKIFKEGAKENTITLSNKKPQGTAFHLSGSLMLNGKKIGLAGIEIAADELLEISKDYTGLGNSGEIYLGQRLENGQLSYITPLRFDRLAANRIITDDSKPMHKALMGEENTYSEIKDYRGENVLAATRSVGDSGWGLVAKMDRSEALIPLISLRSELLLLAFINSVLVVFTAIALARRFTQPILDIDEVAEQIGKGNLKYRVASPSDDEIGNLAGTFNTMLDNLEAFDKAKSDFVSLASHQLRTPLTSIKWSAEELLNPKTKLKNTQQKSYLQQIHSSNERMIELVRALLSVSKLDVGSLPLKKEPVQIADTLDHVLIDLDALIRGKNMVINKKIDNKLGEINADRNWIRVILQNLISNAIRYSPPDQKIDVRIEQQPEHLLIQVKDRGYGIPAAQQDHLFTKFFRADNAQKLGSDGSGLGLYITKAMVERTGGSIWFTSVQNKGTTFYVKLPINNNGLASKGDDSHGRSK